MFTDISWRQENIFVSMWLHFKYLVTGGCRRNFSTVSNNEMY